MLPRILEIERASFADAWTENMLLEELSCANALFLCAFEGETLCGYVIAHTVLDECEIYDIAVAEEFRRRGIALALLHAVLQNAGKLSAVYLEVRAKNTGAIALYESFGFARMGLRRGYYENPKDDAILMTFTPEV